MFGLGSTEMLIILALVLIVFGAGRLPEIAGAIGRGLRSFRTAAPEPGEIDITPKNGSQGGSGAKQ